MFDESARSAVRSADNGIARKLHGLLFACSIHVSEIDPYIGIISKI
jgi:hypothetical protein